MRVLLVTHRYPPEGVAGVERYCEALARELVAAGDEVEVVTGSVGEQGRPPSARRERSPAGVIVHRLARPRAGQERFLAWHAELEAAFGGILERLAPDVVHVNHLIDLSPRVLELARNAGAGVVLSLHDYYAVCPLHLLRTVSGAPCSGPDGGHECARSCYATEGEPALQRWALRCRYLRRLLDLPQRTLAPSRSLAGDIERLATLGAALRVLPLGVPRPPAGPPPRRRRTRTLRLAFAGQVAPHKGVHFALEELALAGLEAVELTVDGASRLPEYEAELHERAAAIPGLRLELRGAYEPDELPKRLAGADCAVVPSLWPETFSLVSHEALALGLPVVAARLGALPEIVVDGDNGLLFDPARRGELAAQLVRIAREDGLLTRLRRGARRTPIRTMAEHAADLRGVYAEALAGAAPVPAPLSEELDALFRDLVRHGFAATT